MSGSVAEFSASMKRRLEQLTAELSCIANNPKPTYELSLESLLDAFFAVYIDCKSAEKAENLNSFTQKCICSKIFPLFFLLSYYLRYGIDLFSIKQRIV